MRNRRLPCTVSSKPLTPDDGAKAVKGTSHFKLTHHEPVEYAPGAAEADDATQVVVGCATQEDDAAADSEQDEYAAGAEYLEAEGAA